MTKTSLPDTETSKDLKKPPKADETKTSHAPRTARHRSAIKRVAKFIEKYGPILTIAAMSLAIYELYVVHQSANEIENLSRAAATRYINTFPNNMPEMTKMINSTEEELIIASDFAAYGHFSSPQEFNHYLSALQKLVGSGKKVTLICYNEERAAKAREEQFGDWEKIKGTQSFKETYKNNPPQTREEFFKDLRAFEVRTMCDMAKRGITIMETGKDKAGKDKDLPIFFWISDESRAMFSFYAYGNDPREMSFQTIDASFIRPLMQVERQIESESKPFDQVKCSNL